MNAQYLQHSSWGKGSGGLDVRALRRYNRLLKIFALTGEILVPLLLLVYLVVAGVFLYTGNFENVIFQDGTSLSCVLDGTTGEISNVQ